MPNMGVHAVIIADTEGVITSGNEGATRLSGHSASTVIGQRVQPIIPEQLRGADWAGFIARWPLRRSRTWRSISPCCARTALSASSQAGC